MTDIDLNYVLGVKAGYKFNICDINNNVYDANALWQKENFPDIEITRPNVDTDIQKLDTRCLISVNGYYYPTLYKDNKVYVPNATLSMLRSRANHIGILSFNNALTQDLNKIQITQDMLSPDTNLSLFEKTFITFPEEILNPVLVINGYLIFEDSEFFYRVAPNAFALRLDRLNYIEKLYELNRYRDILLN